MVMSLFRLRAGLDGLSRAGWAGLSVVAIALGVPLAGVGVLLTLTATTAAAAGVSCNGSVATATLVPGDSGSCTLTYTETAEQLGNPFTVTVSVSTTSASGGGAAGAGTATEALLDGQPSGLQVTVTDSDGNSFDAGTPSCSGSYPDASSCSSTDPGQAVPGTTGTSSWSDTFTIAWTLPLSAGNPYQGGNATVTVTPFYNGFAAPTPVPTPTPTGGVAAASSTPTPSSGVSGASTPSTGAGPLSMTSLLLIALGLALLLAGSVGITAARRPRRPVP